MRALVVDQCAKRVEQLAYLFCELKVFAGSDVVSDMDNLRSYLEYGRYAMAFVSPDLYQDFSKVAAYSSLNSDILTIGSDPSVMSIFVAASRHYELDENPVLLIGDLVIPPFDHKGCRTRDAFLDLKPMEHRLLYFLALNHNRLVSYDELSFNMWNSRDLEKIEDPQKNLHVLKLKLLKNIKLAGGSKDIIQAPYQEGFMLFNPDVEVKHIKTYGDFSLRADGNVCYGDSIVSTTVKTKKLLLEFLNKAPGHLFTKNFLQDELCNGKDSYKMHISSLRKALSKASANEEFPHGLNFIKAHNGSGYSWLETPEDNALQLKENTL